MRMPPRHDNYPFPKLHFPPQLVDHATVPLITFPVTWMRANLYSIKFTTLISGAFVAVFFLGCSLSVAELNCGDDTFIDQVLEINSEQKFKDLLHPTIQEISETRQLSKTEAHLSCRGRATLLGESEQYIIFYDAEKRDERTYISYEIVDYETAAERLRDQLGQKETTPHSDPRLGGSLYATITANDLRPTPVPIPTSPPGPTATPHPKYTPTPDHSRYGLSRNQPMPVGMPLKFDSGISITVESVTKNANQLIKRHDAWTEPPPNGHQFLLLALEVANVGDEPIDIYSVNELSLVGNSNVSFDQGFSNECWTFPNELDTSRTLFPTGSLSGNICFTVKSSDVNNLVMYYEMISLLGDDEFVYWALE